MKPGHLGFIDLIKLSLRVFKTNPSRTFLTILGMAVGIGTVLFLVSLGYGLQYILIGKMVTTEDSLISLEVFYPSESELVLKDKDLEDILNLPETEEISPVVETESEIIKDKISGYVLAKIVYPSYFRLSGERAQIGKTFSEKEKAVVISNTALKLIGLREDESSLNKEISIKINLPKNDNETELIELPDKFLIKGVIFDEFSPPFVYVPFEFLPKKSLFYSRVFVKAKDINKVEILRDKLIEKGLLISAKLDLVRQAKKIMTVITIVLGIFGVAALIVAGIGMFNTMLISFMERIFEIGIMKAIGATDKDVRNLFLMESMIMGLCGGISGIILGIVGGEIANGGLNLLAKYLGGQPVRIFIYPWQFLVLIIIVSILVGVIAGLGPASRAARLSAKQAFGER